MSSFVERVRDKTIVSIVEQPQTQTTSHPRYVTAHPWFDWSYRAKICCQTYRYPSTNIKSDLLETCMFVLMVLIGRLFEWGERDKPPVVKEQL